MNGSQRIASRIAPCGGARCGFSLLEMITVVTLLGVLAMVGLSRYGQSTIGSLGAQGDARRIALDLLQAQRRAISTGDNHYVQFNPAIGPASSYQLMQRTPGGPQAVDALHEIPAGVTVSPSQAQAEFTFEGAALAAYQIGVAGPKRDWTISVVPVTGAIRVVEGL